MQSVIPPAADRGGAAVSGEPAQIIINLPNGEEKEGTADVLNGIAAVLWPLVLVLIILLFRDQITSLARRLRRGSAFGAEAEFEKELSSLNREVNKAKDEAAAGIEPVAERKPARPYDGAIDQAFKDESSTRIQHDELRDRILAEASRSPRLGLMLLSAEIDRLARRIAASTGHYENRTLRDQLDIWGTQLPPHMSAAHRLFTHVRNRIVHGYDATEPEILSSIDSGLALYDALASIPIEINVVAHPGVDIFGDAAATQPLEGKGLIIETIDRDQTRFRIFPTTRTYYEKGMRLTWEWDTDHVWGVAWYRDPVSGEIKQAWSSSLEFVGRDLDSV